MSTREDRRSAGQRRDEPRRDAGVNNESAYLKLGTFPDPDGDALNAKIEANSVMQAAAPPQDPAGTPFPTEGTLTDVLTGSDQEVFDSQP